MPGPDDGTAVNIQAAMKANLQKAEADALELREQVRVLTAIVDEQEQQMQAGDAQQEELVAELNAVSDKYRHQNDDHGAQVAELCRIEDEIRARCQAETEEGERLRGKLAMQEIQAETQIRRLEEDKAETGAKANRGPETGTQFDPGTPRSRTGGMVGATQFHRQAAGGFRSSLIGEGHACGGPAPA